MAASDKTYLVIISFLNEAERSNSQRQTDGHKNWYREREARCLHHYHKKSKKWHTNRVIDKSKTHKYI